MILFLALPRWLSGKVSICNAGDAENLGSIPESDSWVGKIPWSGKWQPTPVFLPGESHGQRSLAAYSPRGLKESDTTESDLAHNVGQAPDKEPCLSLFL